MFKLVLFEIPDNKNSEKALTQIGSIRSSVDKYVGGAEHAQCIFFCRRHKTLRDMGYLNFDEPSLSLVYQGIILGSDGQKCPNQGVILLHPMIILRNTAQMSSECI